MFDVEAIPEARNGSESRDEYNEKIRDACKHLPRTQPLRIDIGGPEQTFWDSGSEALAASGIKGMMIASRESDRLFAKHYPGYTANRRVERPDVSSTGLATLFSFCSEYQTS